jgi:hypothetical protein
VLLPAGKSYAEAGRNRVLSRLFARRCRTLKPHLGFVDLAPHLPLEAASSRIETVYFIDHGFASVVGGRAGQADFDVGMIGRDHGAKCPGCICSSCAASALFSSKETALAHGRSKNEERLGRWLLMADGHRPLTHKLLGLRVTPILNREQLQ